MITNVKSNSNYLIFVSSSEVDSISNLAINNVNTTVMYVLKSNISDATHIDFDNVSHSMHFKQSQVDMIRDSTLKNSGSDDTQNGGAFLIEDSSLTIHNTTFTNNTAKNGGAISIKCNTYEA